MQKIYGRFLKSIFLNSFLAIIIFVGSTFKANASDVTSIKSDSVTIQGRWDMTVDMNGKMSPSWLEIHHSGLHMLVGAFVGTGGSARPISRINFVDGKMSFSIPPQWDREESDLSVEGTIKDDDNLAGMITLPNGKTYNWTAKRAPLLKQTAEPVWGNPIHLFDGTNLNSWHATGENQWLAESGVMKSPHSGSNLVTNQTFKDFKLHIEFRYPAESNSGVYLRGRYEVQVIDSKGMETSSVLLGAVYGFLTPSEMVAKAPGEWQSFDITLVGRMVTIIANGKMIICNQAIPGITGGAIDSNEGEPGPILLQGDHGAIDFRNIIITPAK
ncbi:MAG: DUF1080 domain-containing protein [Bacteroidota bacterium]|nr:DUF1080 domain-containing protein [Bacteroidota bacterium]